MANRLATATSPYLLQHADNPVDWWEWGDEAFAEARRRGVPIFLSVGYAACHWCHVMAHESFEDDATAAQLNAEFVCVKVDREERPDVDAVYMDATVSMTGQGGWPMTVVLDHDGSPFFAGTYFPDRPRMGQPSLRQVLTALTEAWRDRPDDVRRAAGSIREHLARQTALGGDALTADDLDAAVALRRTGLRPGPRWLRRCAQVPAVDGARVPAPASRRRTSGRCSTPVSRRWRAAASTTSSAAASPATASTTPGWCRTSRRCSTTTPSWSASTPAGARRSATASPRWRPTSCCASCAPAEGGLASALDADSEGEEGRFYVWTPDQLADVLGADDGRWATELFAVTGHLRARHVDPAAAARPGRLGALRRRTRPAAGRARDPRPAGPRRQGRRRLERAGDRRTLRRRPAARPRGVRRRRAARRAPARRPPPRRRTAPAGLARRPGRRPRGGARGLRRGGRRLPGPVRGHRRRACGCPRRRRCSTRRSTLFRADDGGFHDTPADGERLVARPRDPSDNASPSGTSATVHALLGRPRPHRRRALARRRRGGAGDGGDAGSAGAAVRRVVAGGRAGAGRRGARDRGGRAGGSGPRRAGATGPGPGPGRWWSSPTVPSPAYRCWWGGRPSTVVRRRTCVATRSARPR